MKPDSGEREWVRHCCDLWDRGHRQGCDRVDPERSVSLPLTLAQRILAALEDYSTRDREVRALAAELRAIVERKP